MIPHAGSPCSSDHQEACLLPPLPHAPVTSMSSGKQPWGLSLTAFSLITHHDAPGISILNNFWPYFPFSAFQHSVLQLIFNSDLFNFAIKHAKKPWILSGTVFQYRCYSNVYFSSKHAVSWLGTS